MKSKGQAAMEFLMTYGWAILVVLIAVGALAYFGLLSPDKLLSDRCVITPGSGIVCDDYTSSSASQNIRLNLGNSLNEDISITAVDANYTVGGVVGTCAAGSSISGSNFLSQVIAVACLVFGLSAKFFNILLI